MAIVHNIADSHYFILGLIRFLFYIQYQSLQILTFRVIDVDGVVGRLRQLMQYAHLAACDGSSREHCCAEQLFAYGLRTRECKQYSATLDLR